ncbi:sensor histidine kinase [Olivibacter domesticus]|uniref:histidine kinase n=1 Tax=Olivibacter domesticus TaxID=407022 RepID=A0A1H7MGZ0_OLID1|nr:ATP-binding protein [Olivibacter domesticus]SEL10536.1 Histidine kinase-, DNA gyrase B-, and HSP90-like ATPase [Olivibacter domesticus]
MNAEQTVRIEYKKDQFSKLRIYYLLALSTIALSIVLGQFLVQKHLREQESDARIVNLAGRQRMLSQQISKLALRLNEINSQEGRLHLLDELKTANKEWDRNNRSLRYGNDSLALPINKNAFVNQLFTDNQPTFDSIFLASTQLCRKIENKADVVYPLLAANVQTILQHEGLFLQHMDAIVSAFEYIASQKILQLKRTEYILLAVSLSIIVLEIFLIFIPTTRKVNDTLLKLIRSESDAQQMSKEIGALYASLEESYERISGITLPVALPRLIAKADRGGNVYYVTDQYIHKFLGNDVAFKSIAHLFGLAGEPADDFNEQLIDTVANQQNWHKELIYNDRSKNKHYMDVSIVPIYGHDNEVDELHVFGADMTPRRLAEQNMYKKDRAEIERKVNEQKFRSILVLEGQEEERKRIAMNIHDGIGQQLTSLKFHMASIDLTKEKEAEQKLIDINKLTKDIIKEVRVVTFNLKPPVLSDYGLAAGLKNLVLEIDKLSNNQLIFENRTDFSKRLSPKIENNIYRIVQEALNNAIKYAESPKVEVIMEHDQNELVLTIRDYGVGFESKSVDIFHVEFGHGFLNMQERATYINGKLKIESNLGVGTIVKLFVPLVNKPGNT